MTPTKVCPHCLRDRCPWLLQMHYLEPGEKPQAEECPSYDAPRHPRAGGGTPMPAAFDQKALEAALKVPEGVDLLEWAALAGEGMSIVERTADGFLRLPGGPWGERVIAFKTPEVLYPDDRNLQREDVMEADEHVDEVARGESAMGLLVGVDPLGLLFYTLGRVGREGHALVISVCDDGKEWALLVGTTDDTERAELAELVASWDERKGLGEASEEVVEKAVATARLAWARRCSRGPA